MDSTALPQLLPLLQALLASPSPLILGATLTAFSEICPDRLDLLHPYFRHICRLLVDADEWGQIVALGVLTRYARTMLDKPEGTGATPPTVPPPPKPHDGDSEDEFEGIDTDLALLLYSIRPLFQSRNPGVVLGAALAYWHLAPNENKAVGQATLVDPLLRLAGGVDGAKAIGDDIAGLTWEVIADMAEERPVSLQVSSGASLTSSGCSLRGFRASSSMEATQ